ncbi:hypothetical protein RB598_009134 [Gaeumannomyces tritici]
MDTVRQGGLATASTSTARPNRTHHRHEKRRGNPLHTDALSRPELPSMATSILFPRRHYFEIDDQPWFPDFLRQRVQTGLTLVWNLRVPVLQPAAPAQLVARLLTTHLGPVGGYAFVDFCAGAGGPTPEIERAVNRRRDPAATAPAPFVLTDLHPHVTQWARAAAASPHVSYVREPVDATAAPKALLDRLRGRPAAASYAAVVAGEPEPELETERYSNGDAKMSAAVDAALPTGNGNGNAPPPPGQPRKIFRLFNLAFHHFDDPLARAILKDTVETSDGFGIFELQHRTVDSFFSTLLFGVGILLYTPIYALLERDLVALIFTYLLPVIPFVLVVDGWVSGLRTRTPDEIEALLRSCGAEGGADAWELRSGSEKHMWPCGHLNWVICLKKKTV